MKSCLIMFKEMSYGEILPFIRPQTTYLLTLDFRTSTSTCVPLAAHKWTWQLSFKPTWYVPGFSRHNSQHFSGEPTTAQHGLGAFPEVVRGMGCYWSHGLATAPHAPQGSFILTTNHLGTQKFRFPSEMSASVDFDECGMCSSWWVN